MPIFLSYFFFQGNTDSAVKSAQLTRNYVQFLLRGHTPSPEDLSGAEPVKPAQDLSYWAGLQLACIPVCWGPQDRFSNSPEERKEFSLESTHGYGLLGQKDAKQNEIMEYVHELKSRRSKLPESSPHGVTKEALTPSAACDNMSETSPREAH